MGGGTFIGNDAAKLFASGDSLEAFAIQNVGKTERRVRRKEDISEKRKHVPEVDRTPVEPPPIVIAIVGPPKVKKILYHAGKHYISDQ